MKPAPRVHSGRRCWGEGGAGCVGKRVQLLCGGVCVCKWMGDCTTHHACLCYSPGSSCHLLKARWTPVSDVGLKLREGVLPIGDGSIRERGLSPSAASGLASTITSSTPLRAQCCTHASTLKPKEGFPYRSRDCLTTSPAILVFIRILLCPFPPLGPLPSTVRCVALALPSPPHVRSWVI